RVPESRLDPNLSESFQRQLSGRLDLMKEVARVKWRDGKPSADPDRERQMMAELVRRGEEKGLDSDTVREFFNAQIEAAKQVQQEPFDRWKSEGASTKMEARDLTSLRQQVDETNLALLESLAKLQPYLADESLRRRLVENCKQTLERGGFSTKVREK